jgi:hypothetical protein
VGWVVFFSSIRFPLYGRDVWWQVCLDLALGDEVGGEEYCEAKGLTRSCYGRALLHDLGLYRKERSRGVSNVEDVRIELVWEGLKGVNMY